LLSYCCSLQPTSSQPCWHYTLSHCENGLTAVASVSAINGAVFALSALLVDATPMHQIAASVSVFCCVDAANQRWAPKSFVDHLGLEDSSPTYQGSNVAGHPPPGACWLPQKLACWRTQSQSCESCSGGCPAVQPELQVRCSHKCLCHRYSVSHATSSTCHLAISCS